MGDLFARPKKVLTTSHFRAFDRPKRVALETTVLFYT